MQEMKETRVQSLGQEDPLEKEMATHSSIHDWETPWIEEPGWAYSPRGRKEPDMKQEDQPEAEEEEGRWS